MLTEKKGVDGKILYHIFFYTRKKKTEYLLGCRKIKKPFPNGNGIKFKMEAWMGFEPIHRGFANRSLNPLIYPCFEKMQANFEKKSYFP